MYGMAMNGQLLESAGWKPEDTYCYPNLSAYAAAKPVAYQGSPRKAFFELFGAAVESPEQLEKKMALNGNLMDFLKDDARRVEKQLSGDDKERFARYLESFDALLGLWPVFVFFKEACVAALQTYRLAGNPHLFDVGPNIKQVAIHGNKRRLFPRR